MSGSYHARLTGLFLWFGLLLVITAAMMVPPGGPDTLETGHAQSPKSTFSASFVARRAQAMHRRHDYSPPPAHVEEEHEPVTPVPEPELGFEGLRMRCLGQASGDPARSFSDCAQAIDGVGQIDDPRQTTTHMAHLHIPYVSGGCIVDADWEPRFWGDAQSPLIAVSYIDAIARLLNHRCIAKGYAQGVVTERDEFVWQMSMQVV